MIIKFFIIADIFLMILIFIIYLIKEIILKDRVTGAIYY